MTSSARTDIIEEKPSQMLSKKSESFDSLRIRYRTQVKTRATTTPASTSVSKKMVAASSTAMGSTKSSTPPSLALGSRSSTISSGGSVPSGKSWPVSSACR